MLHIDPLILAWIFVNPLGIMDRESSIDCLSKVNHKSYKFET